MRANLNIIAYVEGRIRLAAIDVERAFGIARGSARRVGHHPEGHIAVGAHRIILDIGYIAEYIIYVGAHISGFDAIRTLQRLSYCIFLNSRQGAIAYRFFEELNSRTIRLILVGVAFHYIALQRTSDANLISYQYRTRLTIFGRLSLISHKTSSFGVGQIIQEIECLVVECLLVCVGSCYIALHRQTEIGQLVFSQRLCQLNCLSNCEVGRINLRERHIDADTEYIAGVLHNGDHNAARLIESSRQSKLSRISRTHIVYLHATGQIRLGFTSVDGKANSALGISIGLEINSQFTILQDGQCAKRYGRMTGSAEHRTGLQRHYAIPIRSRHRERVARFRIPAICALFACFRIQETTEHSTVSQRIGLVTGHGVINHLRIRYAQHLEVDIVGYIRQENLYTRSLLKNSHRNFQFRLKDAVVVADACAHANLIADIHHLVAHTLVHIECTFRVAGSSAIRVIRNPEDLIAIAGITAICFCSAKGGDITGDRVGSRSHFSYRQTLTHAQSLSDGEIKLLRRINLVDANLQLVGKPLRVCVRRREERQDTYFRPIVVQQ